jgi:hypothetical protein
MYNIQLYLCKCKAAFYFSSPVLDLPSLLLLFFIKSQNFVITIRSCKASEATHSRWNWTIPSFTRETQTHSNLEMKQGLQAQTRGQRQGDFKDVKYDHQFSPSMFINSLFTRIWAGGVCSLILSLFMFCLATSSYLHFHCEFIHDQRRRRLNGQSDFGH